MFLVTTLVFICIGTMVSCLVDEAKHKEAYEKLLDSIVKLNEKRMDALKKLHFLEHQNVITTLRAGREVPTKAHLEDDRPVLLIYMHEKPDLRSKTKKNLSSDNLKSENNEDEHKSSVKNGLTALTVKNVQIDNAKITKEDKSLLRKSWRGSCDKQAAKKCKAACCNAYKNVCFTFKCRSKQKKKFKKGCKRSCKEKFRGDSSSSSSSSDSD